MLIWAVAWPPLPSSPIINIQMEKAPFPRTSHSGPLGREAASPSLSFCQTVSPTHKDAFA